MINLSGLKGVSAWLVYNKVIFNIIFCRRFNARHNEQLALIAKLKTCESLEEFKDVADKLTTEKFKKVFYTQAEAITIFKDASTQEQESILLEALTFSALDDADSLRLLAVHKDSNGIPISKHSVKGLDASEIIPLMLKTLTACAELNCDFSLMNEDELSKLANHRVSIKEEASEILAKNGDIPVSELLPLAVKRVFSKMKFWERKEKKR